jgi:hypothetical protein
MTQVNYLLYNFVKPELRNCLIKSNRDYFILRPGYLVSISLIASSLV